MIVIDTLIALIFNFFFQIENTTNQHILFIKKQQKK